MEPIRVMHVIARMNVGGPAVEIAELMRGLDSGRFDQRLVTGWCADDEADFLETQATDVDAIRLDGLGRSIRPTDDARAFTGLVGQIRAFRPHIVHTHTAKAGVLGRVAAKAAGTGTRIIHTYHGHLLSGYFGPVNTRALIQTERVLSRITNQMITVGDKVRDDLLDARIGRSEQYRVIRSGVELGPLPDKLLARRELGLPDGPVIISMIGRLTRIKRPDRFADVAELVQRRGANAHFLVAGGGDEAEGLARRIQERALPVTMLGWRSDIERVLAATDIVLLTSDNEGTPLSLVQAGLAQIPAVATDVGSVREVVEHGRTGWLTLRDRDSLADAVIDMVRDAQGRARMGRLARDKAEMDFSLAGFLNGHAGSYVQIGSNR